MLHATKFKIYAGMRLLMLLASLITFAHGASAQQPNEPAAGSFVETKTLNVFNEIRGGRLVSFTQEVTEIISGWSPLIESSDIPGRETSRDEMGSARFYLELTLKSASPTTRSLWFVTQPMFTREHRTNL